MTVDDVVKRPRSESLSSELVRQRKPRPLKTRKTKAYPTSMADDYSMPNTSLKSTNEQLPPARGETVTHTVSAHAEWEKWFGDALRAIQQLGCRTMAKEWIKIIHPKKQSTHPYNGKNNKTGEADSESTKPDYWPKDVEHREPDHILKERKWCCVLDILRLLTSIS